MKKRSAPRDRVLGILGCFFLSGAAGLTYQVAWAKALGLIFGHTVYATAVVLAVFMGGLAAGSAYLGRWSNGRTGPITLYARIEFLVAATGALSLAGLAAVRSLYAALYPAVVGFEPFLLALKCFGIAVVLFIPSFLMGATFPILVRGLTSNSAELGVPISQLYWINTLGAVVGTLISGFVLLPTWGLRATIFCAVALNIFAGSIALWIRQETHSAPATREAPAKRPHNSRAPEGTATPRFLLFLFALVGCTAFAYEVAWTRLLAITIGSSTYAFTLILASFLMGIVIGSAFFHRFFARFGAFSIVTFSRTQIGIGIAALVSLGLFYGIAAIVPALLKATDRTFGGLVLAQFAASAVTVLPVAIIFGFNFPMVVVLIARCYEGRTERSAMVGEAYAANTAGAIVGSLTAGFLLVPWLGSFRVIAALAGVNFLLALVLDLRSSERRLLPLAIDFVCFLLAVFVGFSSFFYSQSLLSLSAVLYGNSHQGRLTFREVAATTDLVFAKDGVNDSIAVVRTDANVSLRINGKVDASSGDARTQLLLGHLGSALHNAPRRVLIIGFGGGMTVSAVARYPDVQKIDCVEIEPAVIEAAPYLADLNRGVLSDPRVHIKFDDARNFLLASRETYDLIISEPSNPWIAGIATLFTDEYYAAARRRLAAGGIFVQWVQSYSLEPADLRMIMATFAPHFGEVTLWRGEETDLLLLGRTEAAPLQFSRLHTLWQTQGLRKDFEAMNVTQPEGLVAYHLLDDREVRRLGEGSVRNTDDRTLLEYHAPQTMLMRGLSDANEELITQFRTGPLPANLDPSEVLRALEAGSETALDLNDTANAKRFLGALESEPNSAQSYVARGRFALMQGDVPNARAYLETALKAEPKSPQVMHWLAVAEHRNGDELSARSHLSQILTRQSDFLPALDDELQFAADRKDFPVALEAQLKRMSLIPDPPASEYCRLGAIWIKMSKLTDAEPVLLKGLLKDPYSYACHLELGEVYRQTGRFSLARQHFEWVIRFFPDEDATTFRSLAGVYIILGDMKSAGSILRKGKRIFPDDTELKNAEARFPH